MPKITTKTQNQSEIPKTPFGYFWYVTKPQKKWAAGAILAVIAASTLYQSTSYIFKLIIEAVESGNYDLTLKLALLFPVAILVVQLLFRLSGLLGRNWTINAEKYSTDILTGHILKHSHSFFINRFAGSLLSKIGNVNGAINGLIPDLMWTFTSSITSLLVTLSFLFLVDTKSALVFLVLIVVLISFNRSLSTKKTAYAKQTAESRTSLRARLIDMISNVQAVRQYARTNQEEVDVNKLSTAVRDAAHKSWGYTEVMLFWNSVILFGFSSLMFWFLVTGWQLGTVSTGDLVLVLSLFSQIAGTLVFIGRAFNSAAQTIGEMEEGLNELLVPFEIIDIDKAEPLKVVQADIDWQDVTFEFDGKFVFSNFNLNIPAGQRLGLVGHSGAGKSTFVSLLLRQHDISSGSISIAGQNISHVTQDSLRNAIAVVPQEPALFHRSVRDNIAYGNINSTEVQIVEAAKRAQAHDFIIALPNGYDTLVGERGVKLSGGQKQRVAIARVMLKNAPILILDEATSALDSASEVAIQKALETLMKGKTVVAIAHRLSTLRKMDRIIVLENGKIVEDGTHEELTKAEGIYASLWQHQAGGFLLD